MAGAQYSVILTAQLSGTAGSVSAGAVLCHDSSGVSYVVATLANRAGIYPAACIALTTGTNSTSVIAQTCGEVPFGITGLGNGSIAYVRVTDTGVLARVTSPSVDDVIVGKCDTFGNVQLAFIPYGSQGYNVVSAINVVTDFGADQTGVTDSTTAIQNALNAVPSQGGSVFFPRGTYKTSSVLTLKKFTKAYGEGIPATVINSSSATNILQYIGTLDGGVYAPLVIEDMTLQSAAGAAEAGFFHQGGSQLFFNRVLTEAPHVGIILDQSEGAYINDSYFDAPATGAGAWIVDGATFFTAWQANHAYTLNTVIRATNGSPQYSAGLAYRCTTAGTSASSEPTWDTVAGHTTTSGTAVFTNEVPGEFTNGIRFTNCEFHNGLIGLIDDGGDSHSVENCLFEGNTFAAARITATKNFSLRDCYIENTFSSANGLYTDDHLVNPSDFSTASVISGGTPANTDFSNNFVSVSTLGHSVYLNAAVTALVMSNNDLLNGATPHVLNMNLAISVALINNSIVNAMYASPPGQLFETTNTTTKYHGMMCLPFDAKATLANGANANVDSTGFTVMNINSNVTGAYSINGFTGGVSGRSLIVMNTLNQTLTLTNDATSTSANRLYCIGRTDTTVPPYGSAEFIYDSAVSRWTQLR